MLNSNELSANAFRFARRVHRKNPTGTRISPGVQCRSAGKGPVYARGPAGNLALSRGIAYAPVQEAWDASDSSRQRRRWR